MKETSLYEIVDHEILLDYIENNDVNYAIETHPFDDDSISINIFSGNVKIICNVNQIYQLRKWEAKTFLFNIEPTETFSLKHYQILVNLEYINESVIEHLRFNFDVEILKSEIKNLAKSRNLYLEWLDETVRELTKLNKWLYDKYAYFYDFCPLEQPEEYDEGDESWNGFVIDLDVEENE